MPLDVVLKLTQKPVPAYVFQDENVLASLSGQTSPASFSCSFFANQVGILKRPDTARLLSIHSVHDMPQGVFDSGC